MNYRLECLAVAALLLALAVAPQAYLKLNGPTNVPAPTVTVPFGLHSIFSNSVMDNGWNGWNGWNPHNCGCSSEGVGPNPRCGGGNGPVGG
jgi:hypothetical protein